jgi:hypothetical protein
VSHIRQGECSALPDSPSRASCADRGKPAKRYNRGMRVKTWKSPKHAYATSQQGTVMLHSSIYILFQAIAGRAPHGSRRWLTIRGWNETAEAGHGSENGDRSVKKRAAFTRTRRRKLGIPIVAKAARSRRHRSPCQELEPEILCPHRLQRVRKLLPIICPIAFNAFEEQKAKLAWPRP